MRQVVRQLIIAAPIVAAVLLNAVAARSIYLSSEAQPNSHRDFLRAGADGDQTLSVTEFRALAAAAGLDIGAVCRRGIKEGYNQDNLLAELILDNESGALIAGVFAVMDGHGVKGESLSGFGVSVLSGLADTFFGDPREIEAATVALAKNTERLQDPRIVDALDAVVRDRIFTIFETIHRRALKFKRNNGGSTFSLAVWLPTYERLWVAAVGDSPVYAVRHDERKLITLSAPGDSTDVEALSVALDDITAWFGLESPPHRLPQEPFDGALTVLWRFTPPNSGSNGSGTLPREELRRLDASNTVYLRQPPEAVLRLPKVRGGQRISPRAEAATAAVSYNVVAWYDKTHTKRTYFPVFRLGFLAPTRGIADHDEVTETVLGTSAFIRNDPEIRHYDLRTFPKMDELLLTSDGFANPWTSKLLHEVLEDRVFKCERDCLQDPMPLWIEWRDDVHRTYDEPFIHAHKALCDAADVRFTSAGYAALAQAAIESSSSAQETVERMYQSTRELDEALPAAPWRDDITFLYIKPIAATASISHYIWS